jgi:hypothetical protein
MHKRFTGFLIGLLIFLLNLFDGVATYVAIFYYGVKEINPLMSFVIYNTNHWFIIPKILMGFLIFLILSMYWNLNNTIKIGGLIVLLVYSILFAYHLYGIIFIL